MSFVPWGIYSVGKIRNLGETLRWCNKLNGDSWESQSHHFSWLLTLDSTLLSLVNNGFQPGVVLPPPRGIWQCLGTFLVVTTERGGMVVLEANKQRWEVLLDTLQCAGQLPATGNCPAPVLMLSAWRSLVSLVHSLLPKSFRGAKAFPRIQFLPFSRQVRHHHSIFFFQLKD